MVPRLQLRASRLCSCGHDGDEAEVARVRLSRVARVARDLASHVVRALADALIDVLHSAACQLRLSVAYPESGLTRPCCTPGPSSQAA